MSGILDASEQGPGWAGRTRPGGAAPKGGEEGGLKTLNRILDPVLK